MREKNNKAINKIFEVGLSTLESSVNNPLIGGAIAILPDLVNLISSREQIVELSRWIREAKQSTIRKDMNSIPFDSFINSLHESMNDLPSYKSSSFKLLGSKIAFLYPISRSKQLFENETLRLTGRIDLTEKNIELYLYDQDTEIIRTEEYFAADSHYPKPRIGSHVEKISLREETVFKTSKVTASHSQIVFTDPRNMFDDLRKAETPYRSWEEVTSAISKLFN